VTGFFIAAHAMPFSLKQHEQFLTNWAVQTLIFAISIRDGLPLVSLTPDSHAYTGLYSVSVVFVETQECAKGPYFHDWNGVFVSRLTSAKFRLGNTLNLPPVAG
jgi:hypothetical protein